MTVKRNVSPYLVSINELGCYVGVFFTLPRGKPGERRREVCAPVGYGSVGSVGVRRNRNNEAIAAGRRYVPEMVVSTEQPRGFVDSRVS